MTCLDSYTALMRYSYFLPGVNTRVPGSSSMPPASELRTQYQVFFPTWFAFASLVHSVTDPPLAGL